MWKSQKIFETFRQDISLLSVCKYHWRRYSSKCEFERLWKINCI